MWTLKWLTFCWDSKGSTPRILVFSVTGTVEQLVNTGKKDWPAREDLTVGDKNVINQPAAS